MIAILVQGADQRAAKSSARGHVSSQRRDAGAWNLQHLTLFAIQQPSRRAKL